MLNKRAERHYREFREAGHTALHSLSWARYRIEQEMMLERFGDWQFDSGQYGTFAYADLEDVPGPFCIRVMAGEDDHGIDWGDCEPTDEEREHASAFYYCVVVLPLDDESYVIETEFYHDGIGGVDVIDLPGYMQRDWEDGAAYALREYLLDGALRYVANEDTERTYWAQRDVMTIDREESIR